MSHHVISTILRHDAKQTSYKIALLRALNDVVLAYPDADTDGHEHVAVPLRMLAEAWIAYYWPFVDPLEPPVLQGVPSLRGDRPRHDVSFRPHLEKLRRTVEEIYGPSGPDGGWHLVEHMRIERKRRHYPAALVELYDAALRQTQKAIRQPIQYAGAGTWTVFDRPRRAALLPDHAHLPGVRPSDVCVAVPAELWRAFHDVSLWVEALCIHEWSLFTARMAGDPTWRGRAYTLLTERPDNRLPIGWERNQIDIMMHEGTHFDCPWTGKRLAPGAYHLDHIVPVSIYPFHELWNLVPADAHFNAHQKRARLPGVEALRRSLPRLAGTYEAYGASRQLSPALRGDVAIRFTRSDTSAHGVASSVSHLVERIATARNVARF